jgi:hypothetical protein
VIWISAVGILLPLLLSYAAYQFGKWRSAAGCSLMRLQANGKEARCKMPVKPDKLFCKEHLCHWCEIRGTPSEGVRCSVCAHAAQTREQGDKSNHASDASSYYNPVFAEQYNNQQIMDEGLADTGYTDVETNV